MPKRASSGEARRTRCPRCGRQVWRQLVGLRAALDVTADDEPLPRAKARALREPNRLEWCLRTGHGGTELRWDSDDHRADCPHPHVLDHVCTAPPRPARPARRPRASVPDGQLTL